MKTKETPELREYISRLSSPSFILRGWLILAFLELSALSLGIAFFIIVHGLILGVLWLFPYWKPAFIVYTRAMNIKDVDFIRVPIPWWRVIFLGIKSCMAIFFIYFGMKFLITHGFLDQNLIYHLISH